MRTLQNTRTFSTSWILLSVFCLFLGGVCQVQAQQNTQLGILRDGSFTLNGARLS